MNENIIIRRRSGTLAGKIETVLWENGVSVDQFGMDNLLSLVADWLRALPPDPGCPDAETFRQALNAAAQKVEDHRFAKRSRD